MTKTVHLTIVYGLNWTGYMVYTVRTNMFQPVKMVYTFRTNKPIWSEGARLSTLILYQQSVVEVE